MVNASEKCDMLSFEFENNEKIKCVSLNGKPLFDPLSVKRCLCIPDKTLMNSLSSLNENQRVKIPAFEARNMGFRKVNNRGKVLLTESGLYKLIFKSRAPKAEKFQDWVTDEVLPSIRKTGAYSMLSKTERELHQAVTIIQSYTGLRTEELAMVQQETWNKKLSDLMIDCSRHGMGTMKELYDELFCVFASETGFDINQIARNMGIQRRDYVKNNPAIAKTVYEFAFNHFRRDDRQLCFHFDKDQQTLDGFVLTSN